MQTQIINASFAIQNPSDSVNTIAGVVYPGGTTCTSLDDTDGNNIWLQINADGIQRLCISKPFGSVVTADFIGASGPYTLIATSFDVVYPKDFHTHPIHAPK